MNTSDARQVIKNLANETVSLSNLTEKQQREFCKSVSHMVCEITDSSLQDYYYEQTMEFLQDKELCDNLSDRIKQSDRQI